MRNGGKQFKVRWALASTHCTSSEFIFRLAFISPRPDAFAHFSHFPGIIWVLKDKLRLPLQVCMCAMDRYAPPPHTLFCTYFDFLSCPLWETRESASSFCHNYAQTPWGDRAARRGKHSRDGGPWKEALCCFRRGRGFSLSEVVVLGQQPELQTLSLAAIKPPSGETGPSWTDPQSQAGLSWLDLAKTHHRGLQK